MEQGFCSVSPANAVGLKWGVIVQIYFYGPERGKENWLFKAVTISFEIWQCDRISLKKCSNFGSALGWD